MAERVDDLIVQFSECLDFFDHHVGFVGPSVYFHNRTLAVRQGCKSAADLFERLAFFEYLYATLTAWGLHRMGRGNTKLVDFEEFSDSLRTQSALIAPLWTLSLTALGEADLEAVTRQLWEVLGRLRVSVASVRIVANSKALHHVLPFLVPPIDRTYTYTFFYNSKMMRSEQEEAAFQEMFEQFHRIACARKWEILAHVGQGFHTSESKVIDNAIVGYVLANLRKPGGSPPGGRLGSDEG